jgi:glycosyltransferase involved in cell wall biosynthesis
VLDADDLLRDEPSCRIVLVGSGKEEPRLREEADQRGLDNVLFLPPVPKVDMPGTLAGADACLAILKPIEMYKTTYPNKVFDYMAASRPVILAIDGVIRTVVEGAQAGVFVQPGDPQALAETIRQMANNPEKCRKMGMNGRILIETQFSRDDFAEKFALILDEMRK